VLGICEISKYQYYNDPTGMKGGARPSTTTIKISENSELVEVSNIEVVDEMIQIKRNPETDYGYRAMCAALCLLGFIINHKKVYRLMGLYQLLLDRNARAKRKYVRYRRVTPNGPLQVLEMDIKFQWVQQHSRYAYILTVIDTFSRKVLDWMVAYSIRQSEVKDIWERIIVYHLQPADLLSREITVEVRNDNDSRFTAKMIQDYLETNQINQVFTHPYTPQENGHIESFHSILGKSLDPEIFMTISGLERHLENFYQIYNNVRLHGSLDHLTPKMFCKLWANGLIDRIELSNYRYKLKLQVPHYLISGNGDLREVSSNFRDGLNGRLGNNKSVWRHNT
jgi:transposase InsO family protein